MYKILVVDDSALMRRVICDIINADSDFRVVDVSADGEDAYNKIKNNPYDLVVLDMILPKLTGLELLERLYFEKKDINAVLISSSLKEDADSTMKAMEYGALDFVVKPIRSSGETREIFGKQLLEALHNVTKSRAFKQIASRGTVSTTTRAIGDAQKKTAERMDDVRSRLAQAKAGIGNAQTGTTASEPRRTSFTQTSQPTPTTSSPFRAHWAWPA